MMRVDAHMLDSVLDVLSCKHQVLKSASDAAVVCGVSYRGITGSKHGEGVDRGVAGVVVRHADAGHDVLGVLSL